MVKSCNISKHHFNSSECQIHLQLYTHFHESWHDIIFPKSSQKGGLCLIYDIDLALFPYSKTNAHVKVTVWEHKKAPMKIETFSILTCASWKSNKFTNIYNHFISHFTVKMYSILSQTCHVSYSQPFLYRAVSELEKGLFARVTILLYGGGTTMSPHSSWRMLSQDAVMVLLKNSNTQKAEAEENADCHSLGGLYPEFLLQWVIVWANHVPLAHHGLSS